VELNEPHWIHIVTADWR